MNKQPFYHCLEILFTATGDVTEAANSRQFLDRLGRFLKRNLGASVLPNSVDFDAPCSAEPGDPHDLVGQ